MGFIWFYLRLDLFWETFYGIDIPTVQCLDIPATHEELLQNNLSTIICLFNLEYYHMEINTFCQIYTDTTK